MTPLHQMLVRGALALAGTAVAPAWLRAQAVGPVMTALGIVKLGLRVAE